MKYAEYIFTALAVILGLFATYKWKDITWIGKSALIIGILAALFLLYNSIQEKRKEKLLEKINAEFGKVEDTKNATFPIMQIGDSDTKFALLNGVFDFQPFGKVLKLYVKNEKLHVWTIIRKQDGTPIAVIDDNVWTLFDKKYEYNDNKNGFEIVTQGDRKVVFQLYYIGGIAKVSGMLLNEKGIGLYLEQSQVPGKPGALMTAINPSFPNTYDINKSTVKPIFKYPRGKFYGIKSN